MFLQGQVTVANRAVAVLYTDTNGPACVLAYNGLQFQGSTSITAPDCSMASDTSISIGGNASVDAPLYAVSGCTGCAPTDTAYGLPIQAPFAAAIDALTMPTFTYNSATSCIKVGDVNLSGTTVLPSYDTSGSLANSTTSIGGKAYCGTGSGNGTNATLGVSTGKTLTLAPGTYFFWNLNFQVSGGVVQCPTCTGDQGVTLIFLGNSGNTGDISITGGTVTLKAPKVNYYNAAFDGILFYRPLATGTGGGIGSTDVTLTGSSTISLSGGMYFPKSSVSMTGDMTAGGSTCQEVVGNTITFTGNSTFTETGCSAIGTPVPYPKYVMLLE
jgi:hypothetical protein